MNNEKSNENRKLNIELKEVVQPNPSNNTDSASLDHYFYNPFKETSNENEFIPSISPNVADFIRKKSNNNLKYMNDFEIGRIVGALGNVNWEYNRRLQESVDPVKCLSIMEIDKHSIFLSSLFHSKEIIKNFLEFVEDEGSNLTLELDKKSSDNNSAIVEDSYGEE